MTTVIELDKTEGLKSWRHMIAPFLSQKLGNLWPFLAGLKSISCYV